jgi:hypothetical protein
MDVLSERECGTAIKRQEIGEEGRKKNKHFSLPPYLL